MLLYILQSNVGSGQGKPMLKAFLKTQGLIR